MRAPETVNAELRTLFERCKQVLEEEPFQEDIFVDTLLKVGDLRKELVKIIGQQEALEITSRAYQEVFPHEQGIPIRTNEEIIDDIALCYRRARKLLVPRKALVLICMIVLIDRYEKELRANIGYTQTRLIIAFLCQTEFLS